MPVIEFNQADQLHVMTPFGDDFAFVSADRVFKKIDEFIKILEREGEDRGYHTSVKFSPITHYFDEISKANITIPKFQGDFLPYQERFFTWNDFWTGYYSTRLHMKRMIRHVYNDIFATKLLFAIHAIHFNSGLINISEKLEPILLMIVNQITEAENKFLILMHHDAITGTHTPVTSTDYYDILHVSLLHTEAARTILKANLSIPIEQGVINPLKD